MPFLTKLYYYLKSWEHWCSLVQGFFAIHDRSNGLMYLGRGVHIIMSTNVVGCFLSKNNTLRTSFQTFLNYFLSYVSFILIDCKKLSLCFDSMWNYSTVIFVISSFQIIYLGEKNSFFCATVFATLFWFYVYVLISYTVFSISLSTDLFM